MAVRILGAAGLSLMLANEATLAATMPAADALTRAARVSHKITLREEEVSDISLATFNVFDRVNAGMQRPRARPGVIVSQGACGADLYYPQTPPAASRPVYQAPPPPRSRPVRPAYKYKRS